jgi:UPF0716 protein FxsA
MALLFLLFIVVPLAELYVIIQVGQAIGVLPTIGLLLLDSILGSVLMRAQGRAAWARFTAATQAGRAPAREVLDGALVLAGGALLLTPGFLSDVLGFALLLPPTRALVRRVLARRLLRRMTASLAGGPAPGGGAMPPRGPWPRGPRAYDVDGTARDVDGTAREPRDADAPRLDRRT